MIPLPIGIKGHRDNPELQEDLTNLYHSKGSLYRTPGIDYRATSTGLCRGAFTFDGNAYAVSGSDLVLINDQYQVSAVGSVTGSGDCVADTDFARAVVMEKGGNAYELLDTGAYSQITVNYVPSKDLCAMNGRFVFVPEDGGPLFYTNTNTTTIDPGNFFDAELLPDSNEGVIPLNNVLYAGGEDSFELFRDTGSSAQPYIRIDHAAVQTGYIGGKAFYAGTFVFLGRHRGGQPAFHIMGQGQAPRISDESIDSILSTYTMQELKTVIANRYSQHGTDFVAWTLPRHTLLWNGKDFSFISSEGHDNWRARHITYAHDKYITGDAETAFIGTLSSDPNEYTEPLSAGFTTFINYDKGSYLPVSKIELDSLTGCHDTRIGLSVSKDQQTWRPPVWRSLGSRGQSQQRVAWTGGIAVVESHLGLRFSLKGDCRFSVKGLSFA